MPSGRTKISPKSGRGLGHVTSTIFASTVGYPSDSLASCLMNILLSLIRSHHFLSPAILIFVSSAVSVLTLILKQPVPSLPLLSTAKLDYCNSLYYNLPKSQIVILNGLRVISNSFICRKLLRLKLLNLLISHPSSDLCTGWRLMNELNIISSHSPTK